MKHFVTTLFLSFICSLTYGQTRFVEGKAVDDTNNPIAGVVVSANNVEVATTNADGSFRIDVPWSCSAVTFTKKYFLSVTLPIDGSYLYAVMKYDKAAVLREEKALVKQQEEAAQANRAISNKAGEGSHSDNTNNSRNKKIEHSLDLSYSYQLNRGDVVFKHAGVYSYGTLSPLELDYTLLYNANKVVSFGVGTGLQYQLLSVSLEGDTVLDEYGDYDQKRLDVPVFASLKLRLLESKFQPILSGQVGLYCNTGIFYLDGGVGCEYLLNESARLRVLFSWRTTPWSLFDENDYSVSHISSWAPCLKVGISF